MGELEDALYNANDSSPGPDNVHYQFLKQLPAKSLHLLFNIFNSMYNDGIFPPWWQQTTVVRILKPAKDHTDASNYWPIALTSCLRKTVEHIVNTRLVHYLETNNCISDAQSGFRKQRSTTDHLVRRESFIREGLAKGEHVVAVFFDLEKAYNTSWSMAFFWIYRELDLGAGYQTLCQNFLRIDIFQLELVPPTRVFLTKKLASPRVAFFLSPFSILK